MKAILLTGGNASGKTTLLKAAQERLAAQRLIKSNWVVFADTRSYTGKMPNQFKAIMRRWVDPTTPLILIEGVRIYSAVLRCLAFQGQFGVHRALKTALLLREDSVGAGHIKARCEWKGKTHRADFWESGRVTQLFSTRYVNAFRNFKVQHPEALLKEVREFWIGPDYAELTEVEAWIDAAVTEEW